MRGRMQSSAGAEEMSDSGAKAQDTGVESASDGAGDQRDSTFCVCDRARECISLSQIQRRPCMSSGAGGVRPSWFLTQDDAAVCEEIAGFSSYLARTC